MRLTVVMLLVGCSGGDGDSGDDALDLEALADRGEHAVGYRVEEVTYADPDGEGDRTLRLALWYPSSDTSGIDTRYQGLFQAPGVWEDATPVAGAHPVVVYSHGHQGYAEASGDVMAHLASRGFVVAAPDHFGNTTFDGSNRDTEIYFQRPRDISAVLDHLEDEPLARVEDVVGIGHSFGGYTLHALFGASYDVDTLGPACVAGTGPQPFCSTWQEGFAEVFGQSFRDDRIVAGIPMAAGDFGLFGADGIADIDVPVMVMTGEHDGATEDTGIPTWQVVQGGDSRRVHILGGGHQTYTDFAGQLDDSTIDPDEGLRIVRSYTLAFALKHGMGEDAVDPVLDGDVVVSEAVELSR